MREYGHATELDLPPRHNPFHLKRALFIPAATTQPLTPPKPVQPHFHPFRDPLDPSPLPSHSDPVIKPSPTPSAVRLACRSARQLACIYARDLSKKS